jgi:cephalosporin-C deacetylase-like acetyl esterase
MTMLKRSRGVLLSLLLPLIPQGANAMNLNLALPYGDACAPPQTPYLSFRSPQSEEMLFNSGEKIEIVCQAGLRSVALRWTLHRNRIDKPFREGIAEALPGNRFVIRVDTDGLHPGFYDLNVELDTGVSNQEKDRLLQRPVKGRCTFGWKSEAMAIAESRPADFKAFWVAAKAKLAQIPLEAKEGPMQVFGPKEINDYNLTGAALPPDYDPAGHKCETVESCKVDFAGPDGGRVYGWLAKPEGKGPFPAMLVLPGGGFNARPRPLEHARHGYLTLDIQVWGMDVDLKEYPQIDGVNANQVYEPVSGYFFYNVHLRCLQAVNYLLSRPEVDPKRLVVVGGSQGGRLSIVLAGLDPRIAAAVPAIAHGLNDPYGRWATACNKSKADGMEVAGAPPLLTEPADRCYAYYDPMNFAPDAKCPALFNAGLVDPVSPPYGVFAGFNRWGGKDKTMIAIDGHGHDWSGEFDRRAWRWLDKVLNRNPKQ